jgi:hypothetical protein
VDKFLSFNEYEILEGFGKVSRKQAEQKAYSEYEQFNKQQTIESDFDKQTKALLTQALKNKRQPNED